MVRFDLGGVGVMFIIDIEMGFDKFVLINVVWGFGENVVQGKVELDEYEVYKLLLFELLLLLIVGKKLGGKGFKMIYMNDGDYLIKNVLILKVECVSFVLSDYEIFILL